MSIGVSAGRIEGLRRDVRIGKEPVSKTGRAFVAFGVRVPVPPPAPVAQPG